MVFDTDVLIWFLRGNENALAAVLDSIPFSISVVTYMELLQGMRNKHEMEKMKKAFKEMEVKILPIDEKISYRASSYVEEYALSHTMELADALIAGTCVEKDEILYTANDKHYRMIDGLRVNIFRP